MQKRIQTYFSSIKMARQVCNPKCEVCQTAIKIAELRRTMVKLQDVLYLDRYNNVKLTDTHAIIEYKR
jgi:hypothetical protein